MILHLRSVLDKLLHIGSFVLQCAQTPGEDSPLYAPSLKIPLEIPTEDPLSYDKNSGSGASLTH